MHTLPFSIVWIRLRYIACLLLMLCSFVYAQFAQAQNWSGSYFRDTPNNWAATAMTKNEATGLWETQQTFAGTNPRFKISRYADNWNEAYPAQDYLITGGEGDYKITFSDTTKKALSQCGFAVATSSSAASSSSSAVSSSVSADVTSALV